MADDFAAAAFDAGAFNVPQVAPPGVIVPYGTRTPTRPLLSFGRREGFMGGVNRANEVFMTTEPVERDVRSGPTMTLRQDTAEDEIMQAEDNTPEEDVAALQEAADALSEMSEASVSQQKAAKRPKSAKSPKGKAGKKPKPPRKSKSAPKLVSKAPRKSAAIVVAAAGDKPLPPKKRHKSPAGVIGLKPPAAKKARTHGAGGLPTLHLQTYIYKVLKQIHKDVGISTKGINVMNGIVAYAFGKIVENAASIMRLRKAKTMTGRDIAGGVRLWMGENKQLVAHAMSEGAKAMTKYGDDVE